MDFHCPKRISRYVFGDFVTFYWPKFLFVLPLAQYGSRLSRTEHIHVPQRINLEDCLSTSELSSFTIPRQKY